MPTPPAVKKVKQESLQQRDGSAGDTKGHWCLGLIELNEDPEVGREPRENDIKLEKTEPIDLVEQQLQEDYDVINETVVMNEHALDASAAETVDLAKAKLRRREDVELRGLIEQESEKRRVALAKLLVYMHRHNVSDLKTIIDGTQATDSAHTEKQSHHACEQLTFEITETYARLVDAQEATWSKRASIHTERIVDLEAKLNHLVARRHQELMVVVRSGPRLRHYIRAQLQQQEMEG